MAWPSGHEFNDAVQDPRSCFGDPDVWGEVAEDRRHPQCRNAAGDAKRAVNLVKTLQAAQQP